MSDLYFEYQFAVSIFYEKYCLSECIDGKYEQKSLKTNSFVFFHYIESVKVFSCVYSVILR